MDAFVTVISFNYFHEVGVVQSLLESEGIECFVKDGFTVQVNPFYSNAVGGIKLQVKSSQYEEAVSVLEINGYLTAQQLSNEFDFFNFFDKITSKVPFLKNYRAEMRFIILSVIIVSIITLLIYVLTKPSDIDELTRKNWCMSYVEFEGKNYIPVTFEMFKFSGYGLCDEFVDFMKNGDLRLPGFNSRTIYGKWKLKNNTLIISETDTFDFVYNGSYKLKISDSRLTLTSSKTKIYCY
jgi:hypothetical protein